MNIAFYALVWLTLFAASTFLAGRPVDFLKQQIVESSARYAAEFRRQSDASTSPVLLARVEVLAPVAVFALAFAGGIGIVLPAVVAIALFLAPRMMVNIMATRRVEALNEAFPEMLSMLVANLRAGQSITESFRAVQNTAPEPMASELRLVCREIDLGSRAEDALRGAAARAQVPAFGALATALSIVQSRGGDAPLLLHQFAETIGTLRASEEAIKTETSGARFQGYLMLGMVPVFLVLLHFMDPSVIPNLFGTILGNVILAVVGALCVAAYHMIQTFCNPDF